MGCSDYFGAENDWLTDMMKLRVCMRTVWVLCVGMLLFFSSPLQARGDAVPPAPVPPRLVNDYAGILQQEALGLERLLVAFNDSTSNQITIVTLSDLGGYPVSQMAYEIGERWGVGNAKYNNGVVILIKPRNRQGGGEVFIAPGYGLEAALPDVVCKRIIEDEMIPYFRQERYGEGLVAGLRVIMPLVSGEISAKEYMPGEDAWFVLVVVLFMIIALTGIAVLARRKNRNNRNGGKGGGSSRSEEQLQRTLRATLWGGLLGSSGSGHSGGYGGGYGGGFGGFGGGSFGGGGAGGRF